MSTKSKKISRMIKDSLPSLLLHGHFNMNDEQKSKIIKFLLNIANEESNDDKIFSIVEPNKWQVFNNEYFKLHERKNRTPYYSNCSNGKGGERYLHRVVWEYYNGEIPKGYDIHHKDFNSLNNDINNLQLLTHKEHVAIHHRYNLTENLSEYTCAICGKQFQSHKNSMTLYCNNECRYTAWRRQKAEKKNLKK